jgi:hypothetical protein
VDCRYKIRVSFQQNTSSRAHIYYAAVRKSGNQRQGNEHNIYDNPCVPSVVCEVNYIEISDEDSGPQVCVSINRIV